MTKPKFYVVRVGRQPGIYTNWEDCKKQINGFSGAKYKAFPSRKAAELALLYGWENEERNGHTTVQPDGDTGIGDIDLDSISVDAACSGNPGTVEYRGVDTRTGQVIFSHGPIANGTNNLGEFLAIVHALAYLQRIGSNKTVYSDSRTAIAWVRDKRVKSELPRNDSTKEIWALVDRALYWLKQHDYKNHVKKWDTQTHGEILADYGRKS